MALYLSEVVSVAGKPGLHKVIAKRTSGLIVESLDDDKKKFPTSLTQKVSFLSDISIYTMEGDEKLAHVLKLLHEKISAGLAPISKKNSGDEIRTFFREVLENFDDQQVYNSDIIKLVNWYDILKDKVDFDQLEKAEETHEDLDAAAKQAAKKSLEKPKTKAPKAQTRAKGAVKKTGNLKSGKS